MSLDHLQNVLLSDHTVLCDVSCIFSKTWFEQTCGENSKRSIMPEV